MSVRAKFKVDSIEYSMQSQATRNSDGTYAKNDTGGYIYEQTKMATIKMSPVSANNDPNHENSKFWSASPGGSFIMNCVNAAATEQLVIGEEYYFDISPAPKS